MRGSFTRRLAVLIASALAVNLLPFAMSPAYAALTATASTNVHRMYRGDSATHTFTINSTGTPETIGSVGIFRPSDQWNITACPVAPAGWSASVQVVSGFQYCRYNSAAGTTDNLASSSSDFQVTATAVAGSTNATGNWPVIIDSDDTIDFATTPTTATAIGEGLGAGIYVFELTDAVVGTSAPAVGSACPAPSKKAPTGSTRVTSVCGRNHANVALTPQANRSALSGTFIATAATFGSASIPAGSGNVVLAKYSNTRITNSAGVGQTVIAQIGSATANRSISTTFTGYISDTTAPAAPSVPDLTAGTDSGTSSTDGLTNVPTPTFTGTAEANSTVEILVGGVVKGSGVATGGNYSVTIPGGNALAPGTHSVTARATDVGNNTSPASGALSVTIDTSAVTPNLSTLTPDPRNDSVVAWTFGSNGESGATTFSCTLTKPVGPPVTGACTSPKTYDLASETDGDYTFSVTQTDAAGNTSAPATDNFTLDRAAVAPDITERPANLTNDPAPSWSFTGEAGGTFSCTLTKPVGPPVTGACTSPQVYDLASEADGDYTFSVTQTDTAGNTSAPATDSFTLDRAVVAPDITERPANLTNDPAPSWSFTGEAGATFTCVLTKPDTTQLTDPSCSSTKNYDLSGSPDGTYTFAVSQTDQTSNSSLEAIDTFVLDRMIDDPTIVSGPMDHDDDDTPTWTFNGESGTTFDCVLVKPDLSEVSDPGCSSSMSYDVSGEGDGDYTFKVRQTDAAGNVSSFRVDSYLLDRTPPRPTIDAAPDAFINNPMPKFEFQGDGDSTFVCELVKPDSSVVTDPACTSAKMYDLSSESDGTYVFRVTADFLGNLSVPETVTFELDRTATAPVIATRPGDQTNSPQVDWTFLGEAGSTFACTLTGPGGLVDAGSCDTGSYAFDLSALADGDHTFSVTQTDQAGNTSVAASDAFTLDRSAPAAPISSLPTSPSRSLTPAWAFSGEADATFQCSLSKGATVIASFAACTSPASFTLVNGNGTYTFQVFQTDASGNPGPVATATYGLDRGAPRIRSFKAASDPFNLRKAKRTKISFKSNEAAKFTLAIKKGRKTIRKVAVKALKKAGSRAVYWTGKDSRNRLVKAGNYTALLTATDKAGNRVAKKITITVKR
jgi:hypothetical protein